MVEHAEPIVQSQTLTELRLVKIERHEDDPIPLERRIAHRKPQSGRVTALLTIKTDDETRNRICSLELRDMSETGLGAVTCEALPRGGEVTIFFPPHGPERGFDLYGKIMWCREAKDASEGFEVGVHLNRQAAACA